jgi:hypothetical protein
LQIRHSSPLQYEHSCDFNKVDKSQGNGISFILISCAKETYEKQAVSEADSDVVAGWEGIAKHRDAVAANDGDARWGVKCVGVVLWAVSF